MKRLLAPVSRHFATTRNFPSVPLTTLPNGIRVVTESKPRQTAAIGVFVNTGSAHETEKNNGVAHFLEHLAFKVIITFFPFFEQIYYINLLLKNFLLEIILF